MTTTEYTEADRREQIKELDRLWGLACAHAGIDPDDDKAVFTVFDAANNNPYASDYQTADAKLQEIANYVFTH